MMTRNSAGNPATITLTNQKWAEITLRSTEAQKLRDTLDHESSAGAVCIHFNRTVAALIAACQPISEPRKTTIEQLCRMVVDRPFPTLLWARLIQANLNHPDIIIRGLDQVLIEKRNLRRKIRVMAREQWELLQIRVRPKILIDSYSDTIVDLLVGLPDAIKHDLTVYVPTRPGRSGSEGETLESTLKKDSSLRNGVKPITDVEALDRIGHGGIDMLVTGAAAVGLLDHELRVVNTSTHEDFPGRARDHRVPIITILGKYKLWPKDLFQEFCLPIFEDQETKNQAQQVFSGDWVELFVTEDGVLQPVEFSNRYENIICRQIDDFPNWNPRTLAPPPKFLEVSKDLNELGELEPNWDSYGGSPISHKTMIKTRAILWEALDGGGEKTPIPIVAPAGDGSVVIEWSVKDHSELVIDVSANSKSITFALFQPGENEAIEGVLDEQMSMHQLIRRLLRDS